MFAREEDSHSIKITPSIPHKRVVPVAPYVPDNGFVGVVKNQFQFVNDASREMIPSAKSCTIYCPVC